MIVDMQSDGGPARAPGPIGERQLLAGEWRRVVLDSSTAWLGIRRRAPMGHADRRVRLAPDDALPVAGSEMQEAKRGDREASARRLAALADIPLLPITHEASALVGALLEGRALPAKAGNDALHVAVAAV